MDASIFEKTLGDHGLMVFDVLGSKAGDLQVRAVYRDIEHPRGFATENYLGYQVLWKNALVFCTVFNRKNEVSDRVGFERDLTKLIALTNDRKLGFFAKDVHEIPEDELLANMLMGTIVLFLDSNNLVCHKDSAQWAVGYKVDRDGKEISSHVAEALALGMFYLTDVNGKIYAPRQPVDRKTMMVLSLTLGKFVTRVWEKSLPKVNIAS